MNTLQIGDVVITNIVERDGPWRNTDEMFPGCDPAEGRALLKSMPSFLYNSVHDLIVITYQTFVVRTPHHTILVDTCTGEDKGYVAPMDFPKQPWLDGFQALGLSFADIDYVFCTHLHIDHTGWNTKWVDNRWVPRFPNARYIFHKQEYAFWEAAHLSGKTYPGGAKGVWKMNCEPVVTAGQALLVDEDFALDDTFTLILTPGHSPHHCCIDIHSRGQRAVITGDLMHHPVQVLRPDWYTMFDFDRAQGVRSRETFFADVTDTGTFLLPLHFPAPTIGQVCSTLHGFEYRFIEQ